MGGGGRLLCFLTLLCAATLAASNVEIDSSILIVGPGDYLPNGGSSRCEQMVDRATALTQTHLMFVPTLFWVDDNYRQLKTVNSPGQVTYYCHNRQQVQGGETPAVCPEVTDADIAQMRSAMQACFKRAVDKGMDISLSPHMDDGLGLGGWRNGLRFDPLKKYGNYSYVDFFLYPLADAVNAVLTPDTKVFFGMQGEMSATVFYFPSSYVTLADRLRARVLRGKPASWGSNVKIGTSTNFNKLCGCVLQDLVDPSQYLALYPAAFAPLKSSFDLKSIQQLYSKVDFIGISSYASNAPNFTIDKLESATYQFATEIKSFGVDIPDLIFNQGKQLYWNEYGVGGGSTQDGKTKATTAAEAAATPFFGIFGQYSRENDPWDLYSPNEVNGPRSYLHYFYNQTIDYLNSGGKGSPNCPNCQYRTDGVFLWNSGTWDIQAIYPESTSDEGSYRDPFLVNLINRHNAQVARSGDNAAQTSTAGRRLLSHA